MTQSFRRIQRAAMTLLELLIVVSILGLLALVAIPKLIEVYEKSRSGVQSYSLADVSRMMENHYGAYGKYPDGLDSLLNESDLGSLYATSGTQRLHTNLRSMATVHTLTAGQRSSLSLAGLGHVFAHDDTVTPYSDSGTMRHHFGADGSTGHDGTSNVGKAVRLDASNSVALAILRDFNLNSNQSATTDTAFYTTNNVFLLFGVGPRNTMVGRTNQTAAIFESATPASNYSRAIAIFMVPAVDPTTTVPKPARFVGVIGPDGRSVKDSINDYNGNTAH